MAPSGKWIEGIGPDSEVAEAARASLAARLGAVAHWLPLAAYCAEQDVEHVHRLRVSTRRAKAALGLYRDWLPRRKASWLKKRLKKIRRAAGDARDLDVLAERLRKEFGDEADGILAEIAERRKAVQPAIVCVADRCRRKDRFARKVRKLLAGVRPRGDRCDCEQPLSFGPWARQQLTDAAQAFFAAVPTDDGDAAALHPFRIRAKALRYSIELLSPAFGPELREVHYPVVEELQARLGRINDHVAGAARMRQWSAAADEALGPQRFDDLAQQEDARLDDSILEFRAWWTPERAESLRGGLLGACEPPNT